jgi:alanyl-tRNA synthetase
VRFLGYESLEAESQVLALVRDGKALQEAESGTAVEVVTAETPFYGASGGQVGDRGEILFEDGRLTVSDTLKLPGDLIVHVGKVEEGRLTTGKRVRLKVDAMARKDTALHHTATHILHAALRAVLGDHVKQAGSLVAPDRLRFDFTHFAALTPSELDEIEQRVNDEIRTNEDLQVHVMDLEEALKTGAMALFEEKYGNRVRLVEIPGFSRELCGGTHTHRTGDIGVFVIVQETGIAAGVRRIEALAGRHALAHLRRQRGILQTAAGLLKTGPADVAERVEKLMTQQKQVERELEALKASLAGKRSADLLERAEDVGGVKVLVTRVETDNPKALRDLYDRFKERIPSGVIVLGAVQGEKVFLLVGVTQDLTARLHAGNLIKEIVKDVGGSGGGRPDMAQAGGSQPENLQGALDLAARLAREKLSVVG